MSSPSSADSDGGRASGSSPNLAFLVRSQDSVLNNMPPDVDNKPLVRQKRRRTSYVSWFFYLLSISLYMSAELYALSQLHPRACISTKCANQCANKFVTASPEDQKILEEEFRCNSKPDKAARMEIVRKVALGEKEVQVRSPSDTIPLLSTFAAHKLTSVSDLVPK
jgi:hypothetical protein